MAMGSRIINKCSCILILFVIISSNSNCEAGRHLLQTTALLGSGIETLTGNITVINVGALTSVLDVMSGNDTLNTFHNSTLNGVGGLVGILDVLSENGTLNSFLNVTLNAFGRVTGGTQVLSGNDTLNAFFNGTLNDVGEFAGTLVLSQNGTLIGSLAASGPLNNLVLTVIANGNGLSGTDNIMLVGVRTLNGTKHVPLSGNGTLNYSMVNGLLTLNVALPSNV